eukprot:TRINITY_DN5266_c0_g1_i1.p1 TRINITY_DN5266_c0_g1~~TRINITY_DN5266_c0_g1_i1.p1  ORF type:complete len:1008 (-),score=198.00 TRINITY_DN5266_c0_g1_i1:97-3120(-)
MGVPWQEVANGGGSARFSSASQDFPEPPADTTHFAVPADTGAALSSAERASRLDQLAERARRLRSELGRGSADHTEAAAAASACAAASHANLHDAPEARPNLGPCSAAAVQMELIMAGDPMLAGGQHSSSSAEAQRSAEGTSSASATEGFSEPARAMRQVPPSLQTSAVSSPVGGCLTPGNLEPRGVHMKVQLVELGLQSSSLRGVFVVMKLGPEQEVIAHLAKDGQRADGVELIGSIRLTAVAERPVWCIDVARQILIAGPEPDRLFLQIWGGAELLGLAGLPIPCLSPEVMRDLGTGGRPCIELLAEELPVKSVSSGERIGTLRVAMFAEAMFKTPKATCANSEPVSNNRLDVACAGCGNPNMSDSKFCRRCGRKRQAAAEDLFDKFDQNHDGVISREEFEAAPQRLHRELQAQVNDACDLPPARGLLELAAPVSERDVVTWFGRTFTEQLVEALRKEGLLISPSRLRILGVDQNPPSILFEVESGPSSEPPPQAVVAELERQLASPSSPILSGGLSQYLANARHDAARHSGGSASSRGHSPRQRPASPCQRLAAPEVAMKLMERVFEVVLASGVEPAVAFSVLDRDGNGSVALSDLVELLRELGLRMSSDVDLAAAMGSVQGQVDIADFIRHYSVWRQSRQSRQSCQPPVKPCPRSPRRSPRSPEMPEGDLWEVHLLPTAAAGVRCLMLPSYVLFAFLEGDGELAGKVFPETWRCFATRCLGLSPQATAAAYALCDQHGLGYFTYRDFRRYLARIDQLKASMQPPQVCAEQEELRQSVRAVLELAEAPTESSIEVPGRLAAIAEVLGRRGLSLDSQASVPGLQEFLLELRLPPEVAQPLLEWQDAAACATAAAKGADATADAPQLLTYRSLLQLLRRARALVHGHLDGLLSCCLMAKVDLQVALDFALRRPSQTLSLDELASVLSAAGADLSAVDPEDIFLALDAHRCQQVFAPDLLDAYGKFRARYGSLLSIMANKLGCRGLSPDELFMQAASPRRRGLERTR